MASDTIMVRDFRCNGCGAPLPIPKNSKGHVKCPSCKNESVIDNLVKNSEMADKENINSGFPLTSTPATLHRQLVSFLSQSPAMPLDIFEKVEVVREEHYCVPAYLFYCTATASFTYDAGNIREHKVGVTSGGKNYTSTSIKTVQSKEWTHTSGIANASAAVFASGNRQFASHVQKAYMSLDPNVLVDFDELDFPHDVVTLDYNLPQAASFNEYVKPYMEKLLEENAQTSLENKDTANFSIGGNKIDKDEIIRIFLGLYCVVFKYSDKEYSLWLTGDGKNVIYGDMPEDTERQFTLDAKNQSMERELSSIPKPKFGVSPEHYIGAFLIPVPFAIMISPGWMGFAPLIVAGLGIYAWNNLKQYNAKSAAVRAQYQPEIDAIANQAPDVIQRFNAKEQALRGIYEREATGDASACYKTLKFRGRQPQ